MPFVNEYIPEADLERFEFEKLNMRPRKGLDASRSWAVDREAQIWLRKFYTESDHAAPDGGYTSVYVWDFSW